MAKPKIGGIVWAWHECLIHPGAWWRVDAKLTLDEARADAYQRMANVTNGTAGDRRLGTKPIQARPGARFIAAEPGGDPATAWEAHAHG
jgi:hypothetical protein